MSANCRPTWAISGYRQERRHRDQHQQRQHGGANQPCAHSSAPDSATASPPSPVATSSPAVWVGDRPAAAAASPDSARHRAMKHRPPPADRVERQPVRPGPGSSRWQMRAELPSAPRASLPNRSIRPARAPARRPRRPGTAAARWPAATHITSSASSTPGGHQRRDESRRDRVGEEILDRLDVLRRQRHQVAGTPPQQVGRRQRVQLVEQRDPHLGQQLVGHGVRHPGFQPVQQPGQRRGQQQRDDQRRGRRGPPAPRR